MYLYYTIFFYIYSTLQTFELKRKTMVKHATHDIQQFTKGGFINDNEYYNNTYLWDWGENW